MRAALHTIAIVAGQMLMTISVIVIPAGAAIAMVVPGGSA